MKADGEMDEKHCKKEHRSLGKEHKDVELESDEGGRKPCGNLARWECKKRGRKMKGGQ